MSFTRTVLLRSALRIRLREAQRGFEKRSGLSRLLLPVERNPLRAGLVKRAEEWRWSSLYARLHGPDEIRELLSDWPIPRPRDWISQVNRAQTDAEEQAIRLSTRRGRPLGSDTWLKQIATRYNLQSTLRSRGRQPGWRKRK